MACASFRALLFWCREVLLLLFCQQQQRQQQRQQPSRISHKFPQVFSSSKGSRSHVRHFFGAILGPGRPSVPCCFGAGRCFWYSSVSSSSSSNGSSLVCLIIIISHQFPQVFSSSKVSEVTLGTFSMRFCGLFVLPCLAVLVPGGALATPLSAAAAATAVLVPGGAFGTLQQRQQPSSISHQFSLISSLRSSILVGFQSHVRHFFGPILWPARPSVPCCFGAGRWFCYSSVSSSSSGSSRLVYLSSVPLSLQF